MGVVGELALSLAGLEVAWGGGRNDPSHHSLKSRELAPPLA